MARKPVKLALSDALEDLSSVNFGKFISALLAREEEPQVRRNRVDGKLFYEVADVLVSTFTESQAVPVTEGILRQIGCSQEANRLVKETGGQSSKPGPTDRPSAGPSAAAPAEAPAGASGGHIMADGKHFVIKHKLELIKKVSNTEPILDGLLDEEVIDDGVYNKIRALPTPEEKMRELYAGCLKAEGECHDIFYQLLEKHEKFLMKSLKKK